MSNMGYAPKFFSLVTGAVVTDKVDRVQLQHVELCGIIYIVAKPMYVNHIALIQHFFSSFMHIKVKKRHLKGNIN